MVGASKHGLAVDSCVVDSGVIVSDSGCSVSVRDNSAVGLSVAVTGVGVGRKLVGVGGGAEGSGVMTVLADRVQAVVMTSSTVIPA